MMESFDELKQSFAVLLKPLMRNGSGTSPKVGIFHCFNAGQHRLEGGPCSDVFIHMVFVVCTVERQIGKVPLGGIEAVALVDEGGAVAASLLREQGLAPIAVASPLVEGQNASEVPAILHLLEYRLRQVIKDGISFRVGNIA